MDWIIALAVGLVAGAHTATWGMFKDSPHEGFTWWRYSRSIWLAGVLAVIVQAITRLDLSTAGGLVLLYGVTYVCERACVEFYKTFLREEDQSKYSIPMQFAVKGRVVHGRAKRWFAGAVVVAAALFLGANVYMIGQVTTPLPETVLFVMVGSIGGWFSAFGGAWKDAPIEGFEILKFFRSPVVAGVYAFILSHFTHSLFLIPLGALGFTIGTLETYKTFFFPSKPRGKFAGKPVLFPEMLRRRNHFVPLYAAIWLAVIIAFVVALRTGS